MPTWLAAYIQRLRTEQAQFLLVNVAVNLLFLVRSYVAMRVLEYGDLGLVALLQSVMVLVGTLQFGVLSGGYRLLCSEDAELSRRVNNLVWTFVLAVGAAGGALSALIFGVADSRQVAWVAALGVGAGVLTLLRNWIANHMTAKIMLRPLNGASLTAAALSMAALAFVPQAPLAACLLSIVLSPAVFIVRVLARYPSLRPDALALPTELLHRVLASGFVVFLTGLLLQVNTQVERWYVIDFLGLEALGHLYLSLLFMNLFQLVPSSLDALFLPRLVRAHAHGRVEVIRHDLRRFLVLLVVYCVAAGGAMWLLAPLLLTWLLPKYLPDLRYVYLILPGLVAFTLSSPFAIVFNVLIRYRTYLVAYGGGSLALLALFLTSAAAGRVLSLDEVSLARCSAYALMAAVLCAGYAVVASANSSFRFSLLVRPPRGVR